MTRLVPKNRKRDSDEAKSKSRSFDEDQLQDEVKRTSGWTLDEILNAKDITPSQDWKWKEGAFTSKSDK